MSGGGNGLVSEVTDSEFERAIAQNKGVVVVKFWAEWCGPCKRMATAVTEVAGDRDGDITFLSMNIESTNAYKKYNVGGVPTMVAFRDGQVVDKRVGGMTKDRLTEWCDSLIEHGSSSAS